MTHEFMLVASVHMLGLLSPGPDFLVVTQNSARYSRKTGLATACGIALGLCVHMTYCLFGLGYTIAASPMLFNAIKFTGAGYLFYLGFKAILSTFKKEVPEIVQTAKREEKDIGPVQGLKQGFLTNMLNPKCTVYILSLFSTVISKDTSKADQLVYSSFMFATTFLYFAFISRLFSSKRVQDLFDRSQTLISRVLGGALCCLGLKLALG